MNGPLQVRLLSFGISFGTQKWYFLSFLGELFLLRRKREAHLRYRQYESNHFLSLSSVRLTISIELPTISMISLLTKPFFGAVVPFNIKKTGASFLIYARDDISHHFGGYSNLHLRWVWLINASRGRPAEPPSKCGLGCPGMLYFPDLICLIMSRRSSRRCMSLGKRARSVCGRNNAAT